MSRNQMEDADQVIVVPDTPDRLAFQNASGGQCVEKNGNSPIICHLGDSPYPGERVLNQLKGTGRLVNENRHDERGNLCPRNNVQSLETENCNNSAVHSHEGSFPSTGAPFFRRMNTEKTSKHEPRYGVKCIGKVKPLCNKISTKSSACPKVNAGIPPDRQEGHTQILEQASVEPSDQETKNALLDAVTDLPLHPVQGSSRKYHNVSKWKGKKEDTQRGSMDREKGIKIVSADSPKTEGFVSPPFQSDTSQRVIGKKRLVRNGCISPQNIVKAKQLAEKKRTSVRDAGCSDAGNASLKGSLSITDSDSSKVKGKEVVVCPSPLNDDAVKIKHFPSRNKEANGTSHVNDEASTCFDEQGGWRNPRNHAKKPVIISSEKRCVYRRSNDSHNEDHNTEVAKRVGGTKNDKASLHYNQEARNTVSTPCRLSLSSKSAFSVDPVVTQQGIRDVANPLTKKQKHHGPVLSNGSECSTSGYNDSEFLVRESTWVSSTSRSNRNKRDHSWCIPNSYIQIDESSPEVRVTGSHNADSDVRSRQVEADEILALELQQHLYEETPLVGDSVTDAYIARALQHGEEAQIASSGGNSNMLRLGSLPIPPVTRRPRARSLENRPNRRATRVPALNRRERLRRRLLGQPRTMMSRVEGLQFPPNMGLDMRINILEALEAAVDDLSDISVPNHLFNAQREFNENDYEMLLALDEDNHQHGGATADQINALPQSTLQTDDFDEACAICLETPGVGEVIRHLPCLHKFHKHCIDPWLSRRTSCPVCKSSIT